MANLVRMTMIERFGWCDRDWRMLGILIDATEPDAASNRCALPSLRWSEARNWGWWKASCSGWIICSILLILCFFYFELQIKEDVARSLS